MASILLIEPDRILADTFCLGLQKAGHQVSVCATAQAAIMAADRQLPEVVILELQLVEHSGIEFLYEFRSYAEWQNIPAIILSHVPPAEFNQSAEILKQELKIADYLYKPSTDLAKLTQAVAQLLPVKV